MANVPTTTKTTNSYMIKVAKTTTQPNRFAYMCLCQWKFWTKNWFRAVFVCERFVDFFGAVHRFDRGTVARNAAYIAICRLPTLSSPTVCACVVTAFSRSQFKTLRVSTSFRLDMQTNRQLGAEQHTHYATNASILCVFLSFFLLTKNKFYSTMEIFRR